ncbi:hypothetical protein B0O99DRAFT_353934 [Bisporella sp. PMI_857]|nr:hypothetical protein B0O99DRAFT_353934 [Bisporella sp. PMI_857]
MAGIIFYILSVIAMLSFMPAGTAAVDLRQYLANYSCQGSNYHQCSNIAQNTCCRFVTQPARYRAFSCYNCPDVSIHSVWERDDNVGTWCDFLIDWRSGRNPNCMNLGSAGRALDGHSWCGGCRLGAARQSGLSRQMIDTTTGQILKCERSVEPDSLIVGNRTFDITTMSTVKHEELIKLAIGEEEIPTEFDTFERL